MKSIFLVAVVLGLAQSAIGGLVFYGDRTSFEAANPGLSIEGFEGLTGTGSTLGFTGPANASSSIPGVIDPGQILPGVTFQTESNDMYTGAPGQSGNATQTIASNFPSADTLDILFSPGVFAMAVDLFQNFGGGEQSGADQTYVLSVFGDSGLLGTHDVTVPSGAAGFFGVSSTDLITRINVAGPEGDFEVIDNVEFASTSGVPEPSSLALFGLGSGALLLLRRRLLSND